MAVNSNARGSSEVAVRSIQQLQDVVEQLQSQVFHLQKAVEALEARLSDSTERYVATCPSCQARFDMLAHHYSIGLFDNLVYVKCPKCNKALPVKGGSGGEVSVIQE
jgi:predicted Zn finger-like uncharacterized protein